MNLRISCTEDGIRTYPLHQHKNYEIMLYLSGEGYLRTPEKNYPFSPGTIIIVPPCTEHGSVSREGFKNISIGGEFGHMLNFSKPVILRDNKKQDGRTLAEMIYDNRFGNADYLSSLSTSYLHFLLQNTKNETDMDLCVRKIVSEISSNAFDISFNTTDALLKSGYAEDYIRSHFKKITGRTPIEFLTEVRIKHACFLIDIYKDNLSMAEIAEKCAFTDYAYFCKKFKSMMGISPTIYKKQTDLNT